MLQKTYVHDPSPPFYRLHNGTCANLSEQWLLQKGPLMQLAPSPSPLEPHKTQERHEATPNQTCSYLKHTHDALTVADATSGALETPDFSKSGPEPSTISFTGKQNWGPRMYSYNHHWRSRTAASGRKLRDMEVKKYTSTHSQVRYDTMYTRTSLYAGLRLRDSPREAIIRINDPSLKKSFITFSVFLFFSQSL